MTAIAVVNVHPNPETAGYPVVISDTLLSKKLNGDVQSCSKINLPATGARSPIYVDDIGEFRQIVRMARKPLILEGNSGILAWAGPLEEMQLLRRQLGERLDLREHFGASVTVSKSDIERVVRTLGVELRRLQFLSITLEENRKMEVLNHRLRDFTTEHFGRCYVGGSGAGTIEDLIKRFDACFDARELKADYTPAYALAERISSSWLYMETDTKNGPKNQSPISTSSGGFLDWYRVTREGVQSWHPRLDLHIEIDGQHTYVSRAYFSDTFLSPTAVGSDLKMATHLVGFMQDREEVIINSSEQHVILSRERIFAYLCQQAFFTDEHQDAFISAEKLSHLYSTPVYVPSVHVIMKRDGQAKHRILRSADEERQASVYYEDGKLLLRFPSDFILW